MTSTFPYGIKECEKFQAALLHVKGAFRSNGYFPTDLDRVLTEDDPDNFYTTSMTGLFLCIPHPIL